ncbi:hypothetical protein [Spiroplasma endosymbiont of Aspidapion aeneum]|uniref:hypothetical protein n=1 Tax=Spiroplasma endosymbiont of Aspidapion aeneum TaxID=3066276 RepID=UPI00313CBC54
MAAKPKEPRCRSKDIFGRCKNKGVALVCMSCLKGWTTTVDTVNDIGKKMSLKKMLVAVEGALDAVGKEIDEEEEMKAKKNKKH